MDCAAMQRIESSVLVGDVAAAAGLVCAPCRTIRRRQHRPDPARHPSRLVQEGLHSRLMIQKTVTLVEVAVIVVVALVRRGIE